MSASFRSLPFPHRSHPKRERRHVVVPPTPTPPVGGLGAGNADRERERGTPDPAALADKLAARVSRLTVSHRDPHRFHEEKSEIANSLRELADELYEMKG